MNTSQISCRVCNIIHKASGLSMHVIRSHKISTKEYYDAFLKKESCGICVVCGNQTKFHSLSMGYRKNCGLVCSGSLMNTKKARDKAKETIFKRYGVQFASQNKDISKKISESQKIRCQNPDARLKISIATKAAMKTDVVKKNHLLAVRRKKSPSTLKKQSDNMKVRHKNDPTIYEKLYTEERNRKISVAKTKYWVDHPEERLRVGENWKKWKSRDEGSWRAHLLRASKKGFESIFGNDGVSSLEVKMYNFLDEHKIEYKKQYLLNNKLYDAYLPKYNILLEFDGEFWHKTTLQECKYKIQIDSYYNDILKNEIAKKHNIKLFRIRESENPIRILEIINSL